MAELPGNFDGRHFTTYIPQVKTLRRLGRDDSAAALLLRLLPAVDAEAFAKGWPIAPWYYEQLAIIYRKAKRPEDEIAILQRYVDAHAGLDEQPFKKLTLRLAKARSAILQSPAT